MPGAPASRNTPNSTATTHTSKKRSMMTVASAKPTPFFILRPVNQARNRSPMWKGSRKLTA